MEAAIDDKGTARNARPKGTANRLDPDGTQAAAEKAARQAREQVRDVVRPGRAVAVGRDGQPLHRKRDNTENPFYVPEELKERGWDYQWNRVSVLGKEDGSAMINDSENGWTSVPSDRDGFAGRFMAAGHKGAIIRDGLMLCERPASLSEEARAEDRYNANAQRRMNRQQFGLPDVPSGFETSHPGLKGMGAHIGIEGAPATEHKYQRDAMPIDD
jgi:hypothetical protein